MAPKVESGQSKKIGKDSQLLGNSKIDDFRAIIRTLAADAGASIAVFLHHIFDELVVSKDKRMMLSFDKFQLGLSKFTKLKQKFSSADLEDIFADCDEGEHEFITIDDLADFCQRTISKARALALKLRVAIIKEYEGDAGYREVFSSLTANKYIESGAFVEFAEDVLGISISDSDGLDLCSLYDMDGDNKICLEDFLGFLVGKTAEGLKVLKSCNPEVIVDIKISLSSLQDADLLRSGYTQIAPNFGTQSIMRQGDVAAHGTFGRGQSMWIWRRKQGVCSGRLKPITDIQLDSASTSSAMVLSGYTCGQIQVANQWLWLKRATNDEEEKDGIINIYVTLGRMKLPSDPIWVSPGVGWIRVDGNFSKSSFLNQVDALVWFLPGRSRSMETHMASPVRSSASISEEVRLIKILNISRSAIRHFVPLFQLKKVANLHNDVEGREDVIGPESVSSVSPNRNSTGSNAFLMHRTERLFDFSALYNKYDTSGKGHLTRRNLEVMLCDVGIRMEKADVNRFIYFFNINKKTGYISPQEFGVMLKLSDYEVDLVVEKIRSKLLSSLRQDDTMNAQFNKKINDGNGNKINSFSMTVNNLVGYSGANQASNILRENRLLSGVFKAVNNTVDGILCLGEVLDMASKLELFLTEEEGSRIFSLMDVDNDEKVTESDFIAFIQKNGDLITRKATRIKETAAMLRRWLLSGSAGLESQTPLDLTRSTNVSNIFVKSNLTIEGAAENQWQSFKRKHERASGQRFPGYLNAENLVKAVGGLGFNISLGEARELSLLIAPEKRGRIQKDDLSAFINRTCRSFGVLLTLLERDLLKNVIGAYRKLRDAVRDDGTAAGAKSESNPVLLQKYEVLVAELLRVIKGSQMSSAKNEGGNGSSGGGIGSGESAILNIPQQGTPESLLPPKSSPLSSSMDVVSIYQLKSGIEAIYRSNTSNSVLIPDSATPNLEEWALLSLLAGAGVCEEDTYGVKVRTFIDGICFYAVGGIGTGSVVEGKASLEVVCRDLQRMIREEARAAALKSGKKDKKYDYAAAFNMFDEGGKGVITLEALRNMMMRLQLINQIPETQIPELLAMFDKKKKGYITIEDFTVFAEAGQSQDDEDAGHFMDDIDEEDEHGQSSNKPPTAITKNGECDWLIWFLWRQACRVEPSDPESVITELEAACTETHLTHQEGAVSQKELWNILCELKLRGSLSKIQFESCVKYVLVEGSGKDDHMVDYESLCRYTVRMGRAFNSLVQETRIIDDKKYAILKSNLRKELLAMMNALSAEESSNPPNDDQFPKGTGAGIGVDVGTGFKPLSKEEQRVPRFEKVMRRMDSDGDGKLTVQEFKVALKRLHFKDEKQWTLKMVRRLFEDLDSDHDGHLSVSEFSAMIQDIDFKDATDQESSEMKRTTTNTLSDDEDEDDDAVFSKRRVGSDSDLFRKVNETLHDIVPITSSDEGGHAGSVQKEVRRYFQKHDTDGKGTVTEERFRSFLRRSGLQDRLTVAELRRLVEKLRRKRLGKDKTLNVVDYEKFLHHLSGIPDSIPNSRSQDVLQKLQDAAAVSTADGRPFITLCSLVDNRSTGYISKEELIHTAKIMDCFLTNGEIDALKELVPRAFKAGNGGQIDYTSLNDFLNSHNGRNNNPLDRDPFNGIRNTGGPNRKNSMEPLSVSRTVGNISNCPSPWDGERSEKAMSLGRTNGFDGTRNNGYDSARNNGYDSIRNNVFDGTRSMNLTPRLSMSANSPMNSEGRARQGLFSNMGTTSNTTQGYGGRDRGCGSGPGYGRSGRQGDVLYDRVMASVTERVTVAAIDKGRALGSPFSLLKQFQVYDDGFGSVTEKAFESVVDALGVSLSASDLHVLYERFGHTDTDHVDYCSFCNLVDDCNRSLSLALDNRSSRDTTPRYRAGDQFGQSLGQSQIENGGQRPPDHVMGSGFDGLRNRSSYQGESPSSSSRERDRVGERPGERERRGADMDPVLDPSHVDQWFTHEASPKQKKEFSNVYDSLHKFKVAVSVADSRGMRDSRSGERGDLRASMRMDPPTDFDNNSELDGIYPYGRGALTAPKLTDSISSHGGYSRPPLGRTRDRDSREMLDDSVRSPTRSYVGRSGYRYGGQGSEEDYDMLGTGSGSGQGLSPRGSQSRRGSITKGVNLSSSSTSPSPSKMGSLMWGSDTPLSLKGEVPHTATSGRNWCCAVCLYVENAPQATQCAVCDSPNYKNDKDFQIKEQCRNCTFLNGQFSQECEMCGEPISGGQIKRSDKDRKRPNSTRY